MSVPVLHAGSLNQSATIVSIAALLAGTLSLIDDRCLVMRHVRIVKILTEYKHTPAYAPLYACDCNTLGLLSDTHACGRDGSGSSVQTSQCSHLSATQMRASHLRYTKTRRTKKKYRQADSPCTTIQQLLRELCSATVLPDICPDAPMLAIWTTRFWLRAH